MRRWSIRSLARPWFVLVSASVALLPAVSSAAAPPPTSDMAILSMSAHPDPMVKGMGNTLEIVTTNQGIDPSGANEIDVTLDATEGFLDVQITQGHCNAPDQGTMGASFSCDPGLMTPGLVVNLIVAVVPTQRGTVTNSASIVGGTNPDPDPTDNDMSLQTDVKESTISASIADDPDPVDTGQPIGYTVAVHNAGPDDDPDVRADVTTSASLAINEVTPSQGTCSSGDPGDPILCSLGAISSGTSATIQVDVQAPDDAQTVQADVSATGKYFVGATTATHRTTVAGNQPTCTAELVNGWFEPAQAVWQDDPRGDPGTFFRDRPGKQLLQTDVGRLQAQLPMVAFKPTLLFGIDHAIGGPAPHSRDSIVMRIRTTGMATVPVGMRFRFTTGQGPLNSTTQTLTSLKLDGRHGECGPSQVETVRLDASDGIPPSHKGFFDFRSTGPYVLEDMLMRCPKTDPNADCDKGPTGIKVTVAGHVVERRPPSVLVVPAVNGPITDREQRELVAAAERLAVEANRTIPDYWPIPRGSFEARAHARLIDVRRDTRPVMWRPWETTLGVPGNSDVSPDAQDLLAKVGRALGITVSRGPQRVVIVMPDGEFANLFPAAHGDVLGVTPTTREIVVRASASAWTLAHELVHSIPRALWSQEQMVADCGLGYHNEADEGVASGVDVGDRRILEHVSSYLGRHRPPRWTDQCTYWHLIEALPRIWPAP